MSKESKPKEKNGTFKELPVYQIEDPLIILHTDTSTEKLEEVAKSIQIQGQIQNIVVRPKGDHYQCVVGFDRLRAARQFDIPKLWARIKTLTDEEAIYMSLDENIMRTPSNPLAEIEALRVCRDELKRKQGDIAKKWGKSEEWVSNKLRMLNLPTELIPEIAAGRINDGVALEVLRLPTKIDQIAVGRDLASRNSTVGQARSFVDQYARVKEQMATRPAEEIAAEVAANPTIICKLCKNPRPPEIYRIIQCCEDCERRINYLIEKDTRENSRKTL